jgi:small-conductance mechanosensitive channel
MRGSVLSRFVLPLLLLIAITALLWMSYGFASAYRLFGSATLASIFHIAAMVSTAILCVFVVATLIVRVGYARLMDNEPTRLQRGLTVAVLAFVAAAICLWYSGLDLSTILTTSALVSAIVGLSVQPMLASLMSGLALNGLIRVGDAVLLDGEHVAITSLNWRSVTARRTNGNSVFVPNARLADCTLQVVAHDQPARVEVKVDVPTSVAPHRVRQLCTELVSDFAEVDATQPVVAVPLTYETGKPLTGYRIEFWVQHYAQRKAIEGRVLRRFWYVFQREGIGVPAGDIGLIPSDTKSPGHVSAVIAALRKRVPDHPDLATAPHSLANSALEAGEVLPYDGGERIVLPERLADRVCVLLEGELSEVSITREPGDDRAPDDGVAGAGRDLTRAVSLSLIERALARHIGPYAARTVEEASAGGGGLAEICTAVALEIDDAAGREAFLNEVRPPRERISRPGYCFHCTRDSAQRFVADPPVRAVDYALIVAIPESALTFDVRQRRTS